MYRPDLKDILGFEMPIEEFGWIFIDTRRLMHPVSHGEGHSTDPAMDWMLRPFT